MKFLSSFLALALLLIVSAANSFSPPNKKAFRTVQKSVSTVDAPASWSGITRVPVFDEVCETTGVTLTRFMNEVRKFWCSSVHHEAVYHKMSSLQIVFISTLAFVPQGCAT